MAEQELLTFEKKYSEKIKNVVHKRIKFEIVLYLESGHVNKNF